MTLRQVRIHGSLGTSPHASNGFAGGGAHDFTTNRFCCLLYCDHPEKVNGCLSSGRFAHHEELDHSMTSEEAFQLIENLDHPEGLKRKFAPGHSLINVNRNGEIVNLSRFKHMPTEEEQSAQLQRFPDCMQILGSPGMYSTADEFRERIQRSLPLFGKLCGLPGFESLREKPDTES
jgi:hypothetical protein